ncbi:DUF3224 domain-containing protein [Actinoplanes friuliensis]|uniref:DUF3224 domain-containing protein n=1 Tax=Actinoplanes friuliensis DSM 7358 TaxID=1246995 RepID=U5VTB2_9ACTN|nr:DUF3224 domain-containing protein [Actinoplanes friuliensis]AGZ40223.1 hypothetical protein AFR_09670 [Actinoplanes friuliensis DSM 7358]
MTERATGTFTTAFEPLTSDDETIGRMRVRKTISGDLTGSGVAEMMSVGTAVEGSAGYVAIDRITGTLGGRQGSFVLQHFGLMARGQGTLTVSVVPDSGTGELTGLTGFFDIVNENGVHTYTFDYELS